MAGSRTMRVEVPASMLGQGSRWGHQGWRTIARVVSDIAADPDYTDVETGTIKVGGKLWRVWRRCGIGVPIWTTSRDRVVRYATLKPTTP